MTLNITPPFKLITRMSDDGTLAPDEVSLEKLREVIAGKDESFSRPEAMALLTTSDFPNKARELVAVLENKEIPARTRFVAAVSLARTGAREAEALLIRNIGIGEERVRAGVMIGLGRIGDRAALEAIESSEDDSKRARFAAALIAHRLGVEGHGLSVPDEKDLLELPDAEVGQMQWQPAAPTDVETSLRSLADDPFGIAFAHEPAYRILCGRLEHMLLFNRKIVAHDMLKAPLERKTLAGVVALRNETDGRYSVAQLILTSPNRDIRGFNLLLCQTNGDIAYAGRAVMKANSAELSLRAVSRPGAIPIRVEGILQDGRVEIKIALSALYVHSSRHPSKEPGPRKADSD